MKYLVKSRIDHSADGRSYDAGATVRLDHLDDATITRLVAMGVVEPATSSTAGLQQIEGVGPKTAEKLEGVGIQSFIELVNADAAFVAAEVGVSEETVTGWQAEARQHLEG